MVRNLHAYLGSRRRRARKVLRDLLNEAEVASLVGEAETAATKWFGTRTGDRTYFERLNEMGKPEFAEAVADRVRRRWEERRSSWWRRT